MPLAFLTDKNVTIYFYLVKNIFLTAGGHTTLINAFIGIIRLSKS